jgi:hypothetical protein
MPDIIKNFRASVATKNDLPLTGNIQGDVRVTRDTGAQWFWAPVAASGLITDWGLINDPEPLPEVSSSGTVTADEKDALELELEYRFGVVDRFKEYVYTGDDLTAINIWTDSGMTVQLFSKAFSYTSGNLTTITLTRISDSATLIKTLSYDMNDNLESIDIDITIP